MRSGPDRRDAIVALGLVGLAFLWCLLGAFRTLELRDEGFILHRSARTAQGELPQRDFEAFYGPGVYAVTGMFLKAAGGEIAGVRIAMVALRAAVVGATYLVARAVAPRGLAILAALLAIAWWGRPTWALNTPYPGNYTVWLALFALALLLRATRRRSAAERALAGCVAGCAVLFKQSLGGMLLGGLGLGVVGLALLSGPPADRRQSRVVLVLWGLAGLAPLLPLWSFLSPRDYLLHFLPIHGLMLAVGWRAVRRGGAASAHAVLKALWPFAAGAALPLFACAGFYLSQGALGDLLAGMFVFPTKMVGYAYPLRLPSPGSALLAVGFVLGMVAVLALLRDNRRLAAAAAVGAAALLAALLTPATIGLPPHQLRLGARSMEESIPALLGFAGAMLWWRSSGTRVERDDPALLVLFFQVFLCFHLFPRSGLNVWTMLGVTTPTLAYVGARALGSGSESGLSARRRGLATVALAAPALWLASPAAAPVVLPPNGERVPVGLPRARGLRLDPQPARRIPLAQLRDAVRHLRAAAPPGAPLLVLGNEYTLLYLSGRPNLAPDLELRLFLLGWGLLPAGPGSGVDEAELLERLDAHPDLRVVEPEGDAARRLRDALPAVSRRLDQSFEVEARFGPFRVLRRGPAG